MPIDILVGMILMPGLLDVQISYMFCNIDKSEIHRQGDSKLAQAAFGIATNKKLSMKLKLIPLHKRLGCSGSHQRLNPG